eukprot:s4220_g4.t1
MVSVGDGGVHLQHAATYVPTDAAVELAGSYSHSRGGTVHVTVEADEVVLQNSQANSSQKSPAGTACQNGQIRLHKQLGRRAPYHKARKKAAREVRQKKVVRGY